MTDTEFMPYHNKYIKFRHYGKMKEGVVLDALSYHEKKVSTDYVFIPAKNMNAWKEAEKEEDKKKMKVLEQKINISKITWARRLKYDYDARQ